MVTGANRLFFSQAYERAEESFVFVQETVPHGRVKSQLSKTSKIIGKEKFLKKLRAKVYVTFMMKFVSVLLCMYCVADVCVDVWMYTPLMKR